MGQPVGGAKTGEPREKTPDKPASRTWLVSHVARVGLEPTSDKAVRRADQHLLPAIWKVQFLKSEFLDFKLLAFFCGCTGWFVSDLVGNPED